MAIKWNNARSPRTTAAMFLSVHWDAANNPLEGAIAICRHSNGSCIEKVSFEEAYLQHPTLIDEHNWRSMLRIKAHRQSQILGHLRLQPSSQTIEACSVNVQNEQALLSMLAQKEYSDFVESASRLVECGVSLSDALLHCLMGAFEATPIADAAVWRREAASLLCKLIAHFPTQMLQWFCAVVAPGQQPHAKSPLKFGIYKQRTNFKLLVEALLSEDSNDPLACVVEGLLVAAVALHDASPMPFYDCLLRLFAMDSFVSVYDAKCIVQALIAAFAAKQHRRMAAMKLLFEAVSVYMSRLHSVLIFVCNLGAVLRILFCDGRRSTRHHRSRRIADCRSKRSLCR